MLTTRFLFGWLIIAICLCCVRHVQADAAKITPSVSETAPSVLLGTWRDTQGFLLPPGITLFEVFRDTITFVPDGSFTQVVDKAGGPLLQTGAYKIQGNRLTINISGSSRLYEFACHGNRLMLQPIGHSKEGILTMSRVNLAKIQAKPKHVLPNLSKQQPSLQIRPHP